MPNEDKPNGPKICSVEDCGRPLIARGLCRSHYNRYRASGRLRKKEYPLVCTAPGCGEPVFAKGKCRDCYASDYYIEKINKVKKPYIYND